MRKGITGSKEQSRTTYEVLEEASADEGPAVHSGHT